MKRVLLFDTPATPKPSGTYTPTPTTSTFKPAWATTAVPDSGEPEGGWDKHFADMEKNR